MKQRHKKKLQRMSRDEFLELQSIWYDKLADNGFDDVERRSKHYMKRESSNIALNYSKDTEEYYRRCRQFMFSETFQEFNSLAQDVWGLHAEGYSYDQILTYLNKTNNLTMLCKKKPFSRTKIQRIILNIKKIMLEQPYDATI